MTIHLAKGLEFSHVYIVGMEEDLFPSALSSTKIGLRRGEKIVLCGLNKGHEKD